MSQIRKNIRFFKHTAIAVTVIVLTSLAVSQAADRRSGTIAFGPENLDLFNVQSTTTGRQLKYTWQLRDNAYQASRDNAICDLLLGFNRDAQSLHTDDTRRYQIYRAGYDLKSGQGNLGAGAALFFNQSHELLLKTSPGLWLGSHDDLGSFSLEFRLRPEHRNDRAVIFSRVGMGSGQRNGLEIALQQGYLICKLENLFKDENGRRHSLEIRSPRQVKTGTWQHVCLSYDRISGKTALYIDGDEVVTRFMTASSEPYNGVFEPSFTPGELPMVSVGKNLSGFLDEMRLSYTHYENLRQLTDLALRNYRQAEMLQREPVNREGVITSPVYTFAATGTMITKFSWVPELPRDTFIWLEIRISDSLFGPDDLQPGWYRITNNQHGIYLHREGNEFLRGKYYQWRAHLIPSPEGNRAPALSDIRLDYELDTPPDRPQMLEVVSTGPEKITLRWKMNVDHDFHSYRLYYGIRPGEYEGVITLSDGKLLGNHLAKNGRIELTVSNDLVEQNRALDGSGMRDYPEIKNNVLYYFAVSACDSYRPGTPFNHESARSAEVAGRPFGGSEISPAR